MELDNVKRECDRKEVFGEKAVSNVTVLSPAYFSCPLSFLTDKPVTNEDQAYI